MVRTRTLAVIGVVMLVALAGCGGTNTDAPANETDGGVNATDTTVGGADDTETTTGEDTTTAQNETTTTQTTTDNGTGDNASAASLTLEDQSSNGSVVSVASANLPDGGYVVLYESRDGTITNLLANTSYLESGTHEDLSIQLNNSLSEETDVVAIAHMDTDGNQQFTIADDQYMSGSDPVSAEATIQVSGNATTTTTTNGTTTNGTTTTTTTTSS